MTVKECFKADLEKMLGGVDAILENDYYRAVMSVKNYADLQHVEEIISLMSMGERRGL